MIISPASRCLFLRRDKLITGPVLSHAVCPAGTAHTGVTFRIKLQRKRTFYVLNTIIPVVMLSLLNVLVFLLPASSGEKMALAVTVLLSFTVYLSIISEVMPKTSESISILGMKENGAACVSHSEHRFQAPSSLEEGCR